MEEPGFFRLFADCIPVKGAARAALCDLTRHRIKLIPLLLCEILTKLKTDSISEVKVFYQHLYDEGITQYLSELEKDEWGFFTVEPPLMFPDMDLFWDSPSTITNAIIDCATVSTTEIKKTIFELDNLQCQAVQIRFLEEINLEALCQVLNLIEGTTILFVEVYIKQTFEITPESIRLLLERNLRIRRVVLYNAHSRGVIEGVDDMTGIIELMPENQLDIKDCGRIDKKYFSPNIGHFTEAQCYNSCLNRKVSIDAEGNIRNCPSMTKTFGNVRDTNIADVLLNDSFKEYWNINKDKVLICKDCEFRYVCTDCRVFIQDPNNVLSKPSKCKYDPYTAVWN